MTLPEHVLNSTCHHNTAINECREDECQAELSDRENEAESERWAQYAETGDDRFLTETERSDVS